MARDNERTQMVGGDVAATGIEHSYLVALTGPDAGQTFRLKDGIYSVGRAKGSHIRVADDDVSRTHARILAQGGNVVVEDLQSRNGTFVNDERVTRKVLADGDKVSVGDTTILKFSLREELEDDFHERIFRAARRDTLTGTFRRAFFDQRLESEISFARRHGTPISILVLDFDHFSSINKTYGDGVGDRLLVEAARILHKSLRQEDLLCRYDGASFAVLAHGVDAHGAWVIGERLRATIGAHAFVVTGKADFRVSLSGGVATFPAEGLDTAGDLVAAALAATELAKKRGRNRLVKHEPG